MRAAADTLIFLHIPKTGGSTLHKILERSYRRDQILTFDGRDHRREEEDFMRASEAQRARYRLIKGHVHFGLHRHVPGKSTYLVFMREPIARVLSFYNYARGSPEHYLYRLLNEERVDLKKVVELRVTHELFNQQTRMIAGDEWRDPKRPVDRAALERAQENLQKHFRVVGLMEEFDASLLLLRRFGLCGTPFYFKANVTPKKASLAILNSETRAVLENGNSLDLELYQFAREQFETQRREAGETFDSELNRFRRLNRVYETFARVPHGAKRLVKWLPAYRRAHAS